MDADCYELCPNNDIYAYNVERDTVKRISDKIIHDNIAVTYERDRKLNYLEPLEFYENYLEKKGRGDEVGLSESVDAAFAAECIGRISEAIEMYDGILETNPNNPNALYRRGLIYLTEYDEKGIDMIYAAMEGNSNFVKNGIQVLNDFCVKMGLPERLEECRRRSVGLYDYRINKYSKAVSLKDSDRFEPVDLPAETVKDIVEEIKRQCGDSLERIYMVKKAYEDMNVTFILITPTANYDPENWDNAYHNIFSFLDVKKEDFVLDSFTGTPKYLARVSKVAGSLMYENKKNREKDEK